MKSQLGSSPPRPSEEHPGPAACGGASGRRPSAAGNGKSAPGPCSPPRGPSPRLGSSGGGLGDLQVRSFPPVKIASAAREPLEKPQRWDSQGFVVLGFFPLLSRLPPCFFLLKSMNRGGTSGRLKPRSAGTRLRIRRLQRLPAATLAAATKSCRDRLAQNPSSASSGKAGRRAAGARGPHPAPGPVLGHASPQGVRP